MPLKLSEKHPDYPALIFGNYMFGGGSSSRLFSRIRTKEGLSYGVVSGIRDTRVRERLLHGAIAAPSNVDEGGGYFQGRIRRKLKDGLAPTRLPPRRKGGCRKRTMAGRRIALLETILADNEYESRTMAYQKELERRFRPYVATDRTSAVRRNIDPAKLSYVKAGDFKKAGGTP